MLVNVDPLHHYLMTAFSKGASDVSFEPGERPKNRLDGSLVTDDHPAVQQYELDAIVGVFAGPEVLRRIGTGSSTERFSIHSPGIGDLRCAAAPLRDGFMIVVRLHGAEE